MNSTKSAAASAAGARVGGCAILGATGLVALALAFVFSSVTVDTGETCVVTRMGAYQRTLPPGFSWLMPFAEGTSCYSERAVIYETSSTPDQSRQDYRDFLVDTQTSDGQQINAAFSVAFHVEPKDAACVYAKVGADMNKAVDRGVVTPVRSDVRLGLKSYDAKTLYSASVFNAQTALSDRVKESLAARCMTMDWFTLREVLFEQDYKDSIEKQQQQLVEVKTADYQAQQSAIRAGAAATTTVIEAKAKAESAKADAEAIREIGKALEEYPSTLQKLFIERQTIQWGIMPDGVVPMLQMPAPGAVQGPGR